LERRQDAIVGLERCFAAAALHLEESAVARLQQSVLERTLRKFDTAGDALASRAGRLLPSPGLSAAAVTEPLRAVLAVLLRCAGSERVSAQDLLDLARGDAGTAVAVLAEAFGAPAAPGLPQWYVRLARLLQGLVLPDAFFWLLQCFDSGTDFNSTPIGLLQAKLRVYCEVLAHSFVQFHLVERVLQAAEEPTQRQQLLAALLRALHGLVAGRSLARPGRLIGRGVSFDFMRVGYRFVAPLVRKLIDGSPHAAEAGRLLRRTCSLLSWLLVHAEADGNSFLGDSSRPLAHEWLLRALGVGTPPGCLLPLLALAANSLALQPGAEIPAALEPALGSLREQALADGHRCGPLTCPGRATLVGLSFALPSLVEEVASGSPLASLDGCYGGDREEEGEQR